jgi:hypothetical protein
MRRQLAAHFLHFAGIAARAIDPRVLIGLIILPRV